MFLENMLTLSSIPTMNMKRSRPDVAMVERIGILLEGKTLSVNPGIFPNAEGPIIG